MHGPEGVCCEGKCLMTALDLVLPKALELQDLQANFQKAVKSSDWGDNQFKCIQAALYAKYGKTCRFQKLAKTDIFSQKFGRLLVHGIIQVAYCPGTMTAIHQREHNICIDTDVGEFYDLRFPLKQHTKIRDWFSLHPRYGVSSSYMTIDHVARFDYPPPRPNGAVDLLLRAAAFGLEQGSSLTLKRKNSLHKNLKKNRFAKTPKKKQLRTCEAVDKDGKVCGKMFAPMGNTKYCRELHSNYSSNKYTNPKVAKMDCDESDSTSSETEEEEKTTPKKVKHTNVMRAIESATIVAVQATHPQQQLPTIASNIVDTISVLVEPTISTPITTTPITATTTFTHASTTNTTSIHTPTPATDISTFSDVPSILSSLTTPMSPELQSLLIMDTTTSSATISEPTSLLRPNKLGRVYTIFEASSEVANFVSGDALQYPMFKRMQLNVQIFLYKKESDSKATKMVPCFIKSIDGSQSDLSELNQTLLEKFRKALEGLQFTSLDICCQAWLLRSVFVFTKTFPFCVLVYINM